jgi:hypothetical protein
MDACTSQVYSEGLDPLWDYRASSVVLRYHKVLEISYDMTEIFTYPT